MSRSLYCYLNQWCQDHGWTDLFIERYQFWAFPPGGVLPLPLPSTAIEGFYTQRTFSRKHGFCYALALISTLIAMPLTLVSHSPMPLLAAFACAAISVGILDEA